MNITRVYTPQTTPQTTTATPTPTPTPTPLMDQNFAHMLVTPEKPDNLEKTECIKNTESLEYTGSSGEVFLSNNFTIDYFGESVINPDPVPNQQKCEQTIVEKEKEKSKKGDEYTGSSGEVFLSNNFTIDYFGGGELVPDPEPNQKKGDELLLLIFDDDTFRPLIKIHPKYIEIITNWYERCDKSIEIEYTNAIIPTNINHNKINHLFVNYDYKHKDLLLEIYLPTLFGYLVLQDKINQIEKTLKINIPTKPDTKPDTKPVVNTKTKTEFDIILGVGMSNMMVNEKQTNKPQQPQPQPLTNGIIIPSNMTYTGDYYYVENKHFNIFTPKTTTDKTTTKSNNINDDGISCYNDVYYDDTYFDLNGSFSAKFIMYSTNLSPNVSPIEHLIKQDNTFIIVLVNIKFLQTLVITNPDLSTIQTIFEHTSYGFTELFTLLSTTSEITKFITEQFDGIIFNKIEDLNTTLLSTSNLLEVMTNKHINDIYLLKEEKMVKECLKYSFELSTDIKHKMKASDLYELIINMLDNSELNKSNMSGIKNRLSKYLRDAGLEKKRYNSGYYYYGIRQKDTRI